MVTTRDLTIFPQQACNPAKLREELTLDQYLNATCTAVAVQNGIIVAMTFAADLDAAQEVRITVLCEAHTPEWTTDVQRLSGNLDSSERAVTSGTLTRLSGGMMYPPGVQGVVDYTKLYFGIYGMYRVVWLEGAKPTIQITEMGSINGGIDKNLITVAPEFGDTRAEPEDIEGQWVPFSIYTDEVMGEQGFCEYQLQAGKGLAVSFDIKSVVYILWETISLT